MPTRRRVLSYCGSEVVLAFVNCLVLLGDSIKDMVEVDKYLGPCSAKRHFQRLARDVDNAGIFERLFQILSRIKPHSKITHGFRYEVVKSFEWRVGRNGAVVAVHSTVKLLYLDPASGLEVASFSISLVFLPGREIQAMHELTRMRPEVLSPGP